MVDKITGVNSNDQLNGGYGSAKIDFDEATLYPFQYLTIKPRGYTKHYFIGNEHIATTFGNGGSEKVTQNTERKPETVHESQLMYWFYNMQWGDPYVFRTNTEPENVVWRKSEGHRAKSAEHTAEWDEFFRRTQGHPTKEQVMEFRTKTEQRVWPNAPTGDIPVE